MCWKCKTPLPFAAIYRTATCAVCGADLHVCRNCRFYAPESHYGCHETVDEEVRDKERANFCDSFRARAQFDGAADDAARNARSAFAGLFGE